MHEVFRRDGVSIAELQAEIASVPLDKIPDNSGTARGENAKEGWIKGLRMTRLYGPIAERDYSEKLYVDISEFPKIEQVVNLFANQRDLQIHQVMVNELAPHSALELHRDGKPEMQRWHLPVFTNELVQWYDEIDGWQHMKLNHWYGPVNYCEKLHSMTNDGETRRIHLIVDLFPPVIPEMYVETQQIMGGGVTTGPIQIT